VVNSSHYDGAIWTALHYVDTIVRRFEAFAGISEAQPVPVEDPDPPPV